MTEENDTKGERIDWEWEYLKLQNRITDCYDEIAGIKQLYKKLNARITRMQYTRREEGDEEEEPEEEEKGVLDDDLSIEEKAIRISELLDRVESMRPEASSTSR